MNNTYIAVGYNVVGFHDRDFEASRYTRWAIRHGEA